MCVLIYSLSMCVVVLHFLVLYFLALVGGASVAHYVFKRTGLPQSVRLCLYRGIYAINVYSYKYISHYSDCAIISI